MSFQSNQPVALRPLSAELVICELLLACVCCQQEMRSDNGQLPQHQFSGELCPGSGQAGAPSRSGRVIGPPLTLQHVDREAVSILLASDLCLLSCWTTKRVGEAFCDKCCSALPLKQRVAVRLQQEPGELVTAIQRALEVLVQLRSQALEKTLQEHAA